jgi:flagellar basal-body rod protein FlgG
MERALRTGAMGMNAQQTRVDLIANNLANVNTTSFKKSRAEFQDLMYQNIKVAGTQQERNVELPTEVQVGSGVRLVATTKSFNQGELAPTTSSMDLGISGDGFFQIKRTDGSIAYTRDGSFKLSRDGKMVNADGYYLEPDITIPEDTVSINISKDGIVEAVLPNQTDPTTIGQIDLVKFINPEGLKNIGSNLYLETPASGVPINGTAGSEGFGEIHQNYLEASNVDIVEEMVNMISAQRAYEINSKTVTTADTMETTVVNMAR